MRLNSTVYMLSFGSVADVVKNQKRQMNYEKAIIENGSTFFRFQTNKFTKPEAL